MSWVSFAGLAVTNDWQYSPVFEEEYIRVRNVISPKKDVNPIQHYCWLSAIYDFAGGKSEYKMYRHYVYDDFYNIFRFDNPFNVPKQLAIKLVARSKTKIRWTVHIDVWKGSVITPSTDNNLEPLQVQFDNLRERIDSLPQVTASETTKLLNTEPIQTTEQVNNTDFQLLGFQ